MPKIIKRNVQGNVHSAVVVRNNTTKQEVSREEHDRKLPPVDVPTGKAIAYVRVVDSVKLSHNYHSLGIDVGVEMPFEVTPGEVDQLVPALEAVHALVEDELAQRTKDLRQFLIQLSSGR